VKLDPKIIFYLRHRDQIDEWTALGERATAEADRYFKSLVPRIIALAERLPDALPFIALNQACPQLFLYRASWRPSAVDAPRIAIGIEWRTTEIRFDEPYAGIWVNVPADKGARLGKAVMTAIKATPGITRGFETDRWWPVYRYETPSAPEFWTDLEGYAQELVIAVEEHWNNFAAVVDHAVSAAPASLVPLASDGTSEMHSKS
jgi:hypothetical protein